MPKGDKKKSTKDRVRQAILNESPEKLQKISTAVETLEIIESEPIIDVSDGGINLKRSVIIGWGTDTIGDFAEHLYQDSSDLLWIVRAYNNKKERNKAYIVCQAKIENDTIIRLVADLPKVRVKKL